MLTWTRRFWAKVEFTPTCWNWTAHCDHSGYGRLQLDGKSRLAHRLAYSLGYGKDPGAFWVLHSCDNPRCVRPSHLRLGDCIANVRDRVERNRSRNQNALKTHCPKGHPYSAENTYYYPTTFRRACKICMAAWSEEKRQRLIRSRIHSGWPSSLPGRS